jgi:hypothetical protein
MEQSILHLRAESVLLSRAQRLRRPLARLRQFTPDGGLSVSTSAVLRAALHRGLDALESEVSSSRHRTRA